MWNQRRSSQRPPTKITVSRAAALTKAQPSSRARLSGFVTSAGITTSSGTIAAGSHRRYTATWKRAQSRVRRWLSPATFRPSASRTSPGPTPAKQTVADQGERTIGP